MRYGIANSITEHVEDDLANDEEENPKGDVSKRPAILECVCDKYDLHGQVDQQAYAVNQVQDHEEANGVGRTQASFPLERQDGYCA